MLIYSSSSSPSSSSSLFSEMTAVKASNSSSWAYPHTHNSTHVLKLVLLLIRPRYYKMGDCGWTWQCSVLALCVCVNKTLSATKGSPLTGRRHGILTSGAIVVTIEDLTETGVVWLASVGDVSVLSISKCLADVVVSTAGCCCCSARSWIDWEACKTNHKLS